ncbi:hypothetical protein C8K11_10877 [Novosphingobium sp. GV055]|nr:hypothetical protein C8K11_10877 [Novosphingobium sp. GV055]PUB02573.1 hypothetical protein C8K12_10877 [Novosphingobium sp. GV061]PUB19518.1 hypothetical protein C8K14_10877 [Novosphingobium sp. GV079]PUB40942.1 hypothetical protein C8K10_10877 [Novosphingobium sp. GV027]
MSGRGSKKANAQGLRRSMLPRALRAPLLAATCIAAGLVIAPTVSSAVTGSFKPLAQVSLAARGGIGSFTPASGDPKLAAAITVRGLGNSHMFRFTPAGADSRADRAITVAVRVNPEVARAISVRGVLGNIGGAAGNGTPLRIVPNAFNLGMARGYQSFAVTSGLGTGDGFDRDTQRLDMPDLNHFAVATPSAAATTGSTGRLAPRIALDEKERAGRAPRTLETQGDYQVDFGGSYRLTRNLDVTAGVRYSSDRDRLHPLTDARQDSQAVYLGTQFRF